MTICQINQSIRSLSGLIRRDKMQLLCCLLLLPFLQYSPQATAEELAPFHAIYKAKYRGIPVKAEGIQELSKLSENRYLFSASVNSILISIAEQSTFSKQPGDQLVPEEYQYHRHGIGKNRKAILKFDWSAHQVLNDVQSKPWKMSIPDGVLDKLAYQIQMRTDLLRMYSRSPGDKKLIYQIADGGRIKTYQFKNLGEEIIDTPVGKLNTIKIARVGNSNKRETIFWLAKDWQFLLARLEQVKSGKTAFTLWLQEADLNGTAVRGD